MSEHGGQYGLIVIGDEVLNGNRQDRHLSRFRALLRQRGLVLAWAWVLPDDGETLVRHLGWSLAGSDPVFCCGGIGATPDDRTRESVARAAGVGLTRHPGAAAQIEAVFGDDAYPHRILMADLPAGSDLIPNPYNRIPGFSLRQHYFLPGFPQMAWPMAEWVLAEHQTSAAGPLEDLCLRVLDTPESALIPLMRTLADRYPDLKLYSLPHLGRDRYVELGFRGRAGLEQALEDLKASLSGQGFPYTTE